jgi:hypothetical protein
MYRIKANMTSFTGVRRLMAEGSPGPGDAPRSEDARSAEAAITRVLQLVRESLAAIRFGQVILTVHDGVVVQLDRIEKTRLR